MLQTRLFLECDGDGCKETFPQVIHTSNPNSWERLSFSGTIVVDGALFTPTMLRVQAALVGHWLRVKGRYYCPNCVFLYRLRPGAKRGQSDAS